MGIKIYLFIFIILSIMNDVSLSQVSREWISTYNYNTEDAKAIEVDNSGNVYVTGTSGTDYATVKYNSSGVQQWASRYNGTGNSSDYANSIAVDGLGNVYVTGGSIGTGTGFDFATVKYNSSGVQQWVARHNGSGNNLDEAFSVAADVSGNVYVTGGSTGSGTLNDYLTIKYNSAGILQWVRSYNGTGNNADFAFRLVLDVSGNICVTGWSRGSGTSDDDYATVKYNPAGVEQWVRIYQGPGDGFDQATSIASDESDNVYVTGNSAGSETQNDYATIKYSSTGDSLWVKRYNGTENSADNATSIAVDISGNVFVTGQSYGSLTNYDYATIKYNSSGVLQWDKIYNGPGNSVENANSIATDNSGNVYVTGSSAFSGQNYNYATVKYNSSGIQQWSDIYNGTASGSDIAFSVKTDASGNVYVTGGSAGLGQLKDFVTIKYSQYPRASITAFTEGFYNSTLNKMISDTLRVYLRNSGSPYAVADSSISKLDSSGNGRFYFPNVLNGSNYYIVLKHRNSIETWSSSFNVFSSDTLTYDFTINANKAFGNNQVLADNSPVRFAIYSGDINQDGTVDASDLSDTDNDALNSLSGYVRTDVTGDDFVDAGDVSIVDNNAINSISLIRP